MLSGTQRLSVIMFTDMVGFTSRMEADQKGTLALLPKLHELLQTCVEQHGGKVWKFIGDAVLAEFSTASLAVECAMGIQKEIRQWNESRPEGQRVQVRIGLHAGDVVERDGDIYGDTVNVAARIQPLAPPGGICVSRTVYETVRRTTGVMTSSIGFKTLKGLSEPMEIFEIHPDGAIATEKKPPERSKVWRMLAFAVIGVTALAIIFFSTHRKPAMPETAPTPVLPVIEPETSIAKWKDSIAVLPFKNMSADPEQEFFCDGMTEQIITDLTRVPDLKVIARTSVMTYRKTDKDIRQIAKELGVIHILEGSVRKAGGKIRVTAQLINAEDGTHVWAKDYDRNIKDVFAIQDEVAQAIADVLKLTAGGGPLMTAQDTRPANYEAYEWYLKGRYHAENVYMVSHDEKDFKKAMDYGQKAVDLDPKFALGYLGLGITLEEYNVITGDDRKIRDRQLDYFRKASELDPYSSAALSCFGVMLTRKEQFDQGFALCTRAVRLNPNDSMAWSNMGLVFSTLGLYEDALACSEKATELDPKNWWALLGYGNHLYEMGKWERALQTFERELELQPNEPLAIWGCSYACLIAGRLPETDRYLARLEGFKGWEESVKELRALYFACLGQKDKALALDINNEAVFALLGMKDETIKCVKETLQSMEKNPYQGSIYMYLTHCRFYDSLRSDPRFQTILAEQKRAYEAARAKYHL